jgi:hypothetical protein
MLQETREKAVEKVMKMRTEVAIPSDATEALLDYGFELTPRYYTNAFRASQAKIRLMLSALCHPNQKAVSRVHWSMAPTEANSYYDPTLNTLFITAAMLSPPFFDMKCALPLQLQPPMGSAPHAVRADTASRGFMAALAGLLGMRPVTASTTLATGCTSPQLRVEWK